MNNPSDYHPYEISKENEKRFYPAYLGKLPTDSEIIASIFCSVMDICDP